MGVECSIIKGIFPELDVVWIPGGGTYLDLGPDLRDVGVALGGGAGGPEPGNKNKPGCGGPNREIWKIQLNIVLNIILFIYL